MNLKDSKKEIQRQGKSSLRKSKAERERTKKLSKTPGRKSFRTLSKEWVHKTLQLSKAIILIGAIPSLLWIFFLQMSRGGKGLSEPRISPVVQMRRKRHSKEWVKEKSQILPEMGPFLVQPVSFSVKSTEPLLKPIDDRKVEENSSQKPR